VLSSRLAARYNCLPSIQTLDAMSPSVTRNRRSFPLLPVMTLLGGLLGNGMAQAIPFQIFEPRALGMGGATVALADRYSARNNPAALALLGESQDVFLEFPSLGRNTVSSRLEDRLQAFQSASAPVRDAARDTLNGSRRWRILQGGGSLGLPNLPVALGASLYGYYLESIEAYAPTPTNSRIRLRGLSVVESQITLAKSLRPWPGSSSRLALGLAPKLMLVRSYFYDAASDDTVLQRLGKQVRDHNRFNLDLGLTQEFAYTWKLGLLVRNALPLDARYANGEAAPLARQWRAGLSHRRGAHYYTLDLDLNPSRRQDGQQTQHLALGADLALGQHWRLRMGMALDLRSGMAQPAGGVGVGWRHLRLDLAAMRQTQGFLAQAGLLLMF